jgi:TonB family protein
MRTARSALDTLHAPGRMRRFLVWSLATHAALLLVVLAMPKENVEAIPLTEIAFLEPGEAEAAAPAAPAAGGAPASSPEPSVPRAAEEDVRFERELTRADMSPQPQSAAAVGDQMSERLSQLQTIAADRLAHTAPSSMSSAAWGPAGAGSSPVSGPATGGVSLNRGSTGGSATGTSIALTRGATGGRGLSPAAVATGLPGAGSGGPKPAQETEAHARKQLAGATLMGPIADRPIVRMTKPAYPEWAKREAVEGSVTLYFLVSPDGAVREGVVVQKTSGFQDFDENARRAILAWRFEALGPGHTGDQWGTITFHFRLTSGS